VPETTALGAAWLAGSKAGIWPGAEAFSAEWKLEKRFEPRLQESERTRLLAGWQDAVRRTRSTQD
jgi:glycerol kinase